MGSKTQSQKPIKPNTASRQPCAWSYAYTAALYSGFRKDEPNQRVLILSRDAFTGVQRNGTMVWSSDIYPTWDTLKRQIPTGLDVTASGIAYWCNDTGGWQYLPAVHHPALPPLLDPSDARANVGGYDDYPELYTRWFKYATFEPTGRDPRLPRSSATTFFSQMDILRLN
jgi:alpha-D-xyloside xylohydrolase